MKNPLRKEDHTGLIVGVAAGVLVAGALAYLFLTDSGKEMLKGLASDVISKKTGVKKKLVKKAADHVAK